MSEFLKISVDKATDLFLEWINDAIETMQNDAYDLGRVQATYRDAEIAIAIYEDLQHLAIERSAEMDVFLRPAIKKLEAAYEAEVKRYEEELFKDEK